MDNLTRNQRLMMAAAHSLERQGMAEYSGWQMAREDARLRGKRFTMGQGNVIRTLMQLVEIGLLTRRWETAETAAPEGRPPRALYRLTDAGRQAERAPADDPEPAPAGRFRPSPTMAISPP